MPSSSERTPQVPALGDVFRESLITGIAVVVPVLVTTFVFAFFINTLYNYLSLVSGLLPITTQVTLVPGLVTLSAEVVLELALPVVVVALVLGVGFVVERSRHGERAVDYFDGVATRIPGFGSIYESFRQLSDVVLSNDTESFREVKLVEFPHEGSYTLGFVTTETPSSLSDPTPHDEMVTMFLPMAPNPVMGGHLVHLPVDRVMDVDLTVEEGVQTIVTSGVAIAESELDSGLSSEEIRSLADQHGIAGATQQPMTGVQHAPASADRTDRYDEAVDPEFAERPAHIASRERDETGDPDATRPAAEADREPAARDGTETRPAAKADRKTSARESTESRPAAAADRDRAAREETDRRPAAEADRDSDAREETNGSPASSGMGAASDTEAAGASSEEEHDS